jgi:hypothetical protein
MAANTNPVFPLAPRIVVGQTLLTANTSKDGTGTVVTLYTAGADGAKVDGVNVAYTGTSVATVLRLYVNNGSATTTAANNTLIKAITVPANTMTSEVNTAADFFTTALAGGSIMLPAGYKITAHIAVTVAAAIAVTVTGGDL